jgi:glyoxylase-like metal-dependent hydrolase (beta-lactamase superfamily II)
LVARKVTPDASLISDESYTATDSGGLVYPFEGKAPARGEVLRVAPSLRWARITMPGSLGHINSWLLDDHDGHVAVVDCGLRVPDCADDWKKLFKHGLKGEHISRVFGTHMHPDHIGLAGWLTKKNGIDIWMTRGEMLTARMMVAENENTLPEEMLIAQRRAGWDEAAIEAQRAQGWGRMMRVMYPLPKGYHRIMDGDVLDFGKASWRVVVGSGHSPEHACLWDETNGVLVSGDQVLPRISSNVSVNISEPYADPLGEWLASIDKLLAVLPGDLLVCPAHGDPFKGLHHRLEALRDEHHARLDRVEAFIRKEPARVVDCFGLIFNRKIEGEQASLATGEALAHLRWLERNGRARCDEVDGVYWFSGA